MAKKRILLIDDEKDFCILVKKNLELITDYEVYVATDGIQGISQAKRVRPDLILLDIMMPGIDGFKVLERLKKDKRTNSIPVVMLSAKVDDTSKVEAAQLYNEDYLTKPIEAQDLKAKIEDVFKRLGI